MLKKTKKLPEDIQKGLVALIAIPFMIALTAITYTFFISPEGDLWQAQLKAINVVLLLLVIGGAQIMHSISFSLIALFFYLGVNYLI